tara:strand:+ start:257 stop:517 length:261 start_codon:yes stop_codon:yes gene_type:complete
MLVCTRQWGVLTGARSLALTLAPKLRQVYGALFALRMLVKVYEFRQEAGRAPLHAAVEPRVQGLGGATATATATTGRLGGRASGLG